MLCTEDLPRYTVEERDGWEDDWELVDGVPFAMSPSPGPRHQSLLGSLLTELTVALDRCPECHVLPEIDWRVDSTTVLRPDISVVCRDVGGRSHLVVAPELVVEIISPSTATRDEGLKRRLYGAQGVRYYLLVYPEERVVRVMRLESGVLVKIADADTGSVAFDDMPCAFAIDFGAVFARVGDLG